uniref:Uncharacterized protein n=1 Tax=Trichobilharzia regenti TaxID=157069 RepID=A0AA85KIT4_TRIRE|nr:unnamed protein product [Trichobilharzia regenti]
MANLLPCHIQSYNHSLLKSNSNVTQSSRIHLTRDNGLYAKQESIYPIGCIYFQLEFPSAKYSQSPLPQSTQNEVHLPPHLPNRPHQSNARLDSR